jgi:hypothetical protein
MTDFPTGDGNPKCKVCRGRGVTDYMKPGYPVPAVIPCKCVRMRDIRQNMERGWRGLSRYKPVTKKKAVLDKHVDSNLMITAAENTLRRHLRRLAEKQGFRWSFNVYSDADLMDAWLSRVEVDDIYDADVERIRRTAVSGRFLALVDLVEPPGLLILRAGVKAARNSAMPEVFLEALHHRSMVDKPTWVVDTPAYPLTTGHISFSPRVGEYLEEWPHVALSGDDAPVKKGSPASGGARRLTVSDLTK